MSTRLTSEEVKDFARQQGVDCVGIASVETIPESVPPRSAVSLLPGAKSVVVYGMTMLLGSIASPSERISTSHTFGLYQELNRVNYQVGRFLERAGHQAAVIPPYIPIEMSRETKGLVGELSLRHTALAAGLGVLGRNRLLITPRWGPRLRLGAVVTNAHLEADTPSKEDLCQECQLCIEECPVSAISADSKVETGKCLLNIFKYGLAQYVRFFSELFAKPPEEQQKAIRDPFFWNLYQTASIGGLYGGCSKCLEVCPVGQVA